MCWTPENEWDEHVTSLCSVPSFELSGIPLQGVLLYLQENIIFLASL